MWKFAVPPSAKKWKLPNSSPCVRYAMSRRPIFHDFHSLKHFCCLALHHKKIKLKLMIVYSSNVLQIICVQLLNTVYSEKKIEVLFLLIFISSLQDLENVILGLGRASRMNDQKWRISLRLFIVLCVSKFYSTVIEFKVWLWNRY